jgi:hypothetical protein
VVVSARRTVVPLMMAASCVAALAVVSARQDPQVEQMRRQREAFAKSFDLPREHARLAGYVRTLSRALGGPDAFHQPTVSTIPTSSTDRDAVLKAATELVARRFNLAPDGVTARFARIPRPNAGRVVLRGSHADVEVADRHRDNDDLVVAVVAHEFAHAALERGLAGSADAGLAEDECLVDAAAVMVGFGPIMLRASYHETIVGRGQNRAWQVVRIGELDPVAIAYLTLAQAEMQGVDPETRREYISRWLEPVWSFRQSQWASLRPVGDGGERSVECPTCASRASLLPDGVTYACPVCGQHVRFGHPHPES